MASWQAKVLNSILSYIARPSMNARGVRMSLPDIRLRLLSLDCRYLPWPEALTTKELPLTHSKLLHYQMQKGADESSPSPGVADYGQSELAIFYVRGGGFCLKTPHAHARYIASLCAELNADAFVPDYRLAPEHPFPAPFEDVLEGFRAFLDAWSGPFVLMGDSAGGNLAMALLLNARDLGLKLPQSCVLLSPALDLAITGDSERLLAADDPFFTPESLLRLRGAYLQGTNPMLPEVSPLHGELHGLPPVLLLAGTRELLLEDAERMAMRLAAAGNAVESRFIANMPHVFPLFELLPEAVEGRGIIVDFIRRHQG
ncbi:alpha/beta hydrolase [Shewanella khirikhana]|uniref:Monoterpene epsilon-lactone hydrolase n=1 Tax=Shewanella khirikhana TaxID=1965282 RepID=A0ABM7DQM5_9GAMM|nr:alpha/beta hydrolase [Shewanella khirikhana]AZQ11993.1 Monoterpene epsilon-lactone hydrolase [Shewanella khirikhana]